MTANVEDALKSQPVIIALSLNGYEEVLSFDSLHSSKYK